jgi:3-oxoacyl-[acyl-carrier protein] reductase
VTGVSRRAGIGAAIAHELATAGATVVAAGFRAYDELESSWGAGESVDVGVVLDLGTADGPARLFDDTVRRHGRVDVLVNNAAHWEAGSLEQTDAAQLDRHWTVNLRAAVLLCREFARRLPAGASGRIVNVTSGQGHEPMPGEIAYVVTKAGLDALTRTIAAELAHRAISVNAVDPGPTNTGWMSAEIEERLRAAGRLAVAADTARLVRYLASDAASGVTGRVIRVVPGWLD